MMVFLQQLESSGFSQWVKQSGSLWAFPGILLMHTYGMAVLVGVIAGIDLRILGFMPAVPLAPLLTSRADLTARLPWGLSSISSKTFSSRATCSSVSVSCFWKAALRSSECAAFAIFGKALSNCCSALYAYRSSSMNRSCKDSICIRMPFSLPLYEARL